MGDSFDNTFPIDTSLAMKVILVHNHDIILYENETRSIMYEEDSAISLNNSLFNLFAKYWPYSGFRLSLPS